jgi:hypothetical protein
MKVKQSSLLRPRLPMHLLQPMVPLQLLPTGQHQLLPMDPTKLAFDFVTSFIFIYYYN